MSAPELLQRLGDSEQLRDKYRGALVGVAVGDGLGAPFEGHQGPVSPAQITLVELDYLCLHHTDDTEMTLALAESLLYTGDLDQHHLALTFARRWERQPDRGYGAGTAALLSRISGGDPWKETAEAQFSGHGSFGNGAAMRVAPVALWAGGDPVLAAEVARHSAAVTHTHPEGVDGAAVQAAAVAVALAHPTTQPVDAAAFLDQVQAVAVTSVLIQQLDLVASLLDEGDSDGSKRVGTGVEAHEAVPAAIYCFLCHPGSFRDTIRMAIGLGGDTDTIAAMAGAISGACLGQRAIPQPWLDRTETAPALAHLADRFAQRILPSGS
jgi:poly(ADP-ribose) glycohydrolase ARH3